MIAVVTRTDGKPLSAADQAKVRHLASGLQAKRIHNVQRVIAGEASPNRLVQTVAIQMPDLTQSNQTALLDTVPTLRHAVRSLVAGSGLRVEATGQVAQSYDQREASGNADAPATGTSKRQARGSLSSDCFMFKLCRSLRFGRT